MNAYRTPIIEPEAMPLVALESMNITHREELGLVNRLAELLARGMTDSPDEQAISDGLEQWVAHTRDHFDRENRLMEQYAFPAYPMHSGEHARVMGLLEGLQRSWLEGKDPKPLADFLFEQWPQWFATHVNSMDMVTAEFLRRQGA